MKLHRSQTRRRTYQYLWQLETPMKLHRSQTPDIVPWEMSKLETPMKLHRSQTGIEGEDCQ